MEWKEPTCYRGIGRRRIKSNPNTGPNLGSVIKMITHTMITTQEAELEKFCLTYINQACEKFGKQSLSQQIASEPFIQKHGSGDQYLDIMLGRYYESKRHRKSNIDKLLEICGRISKLDNTPLTGNMSHSYHTKDKTN